MAINIFAANRRPINPTFELDAAILRAVREEMRRAEARADWAALVAECAARGYP